MDNIKLGIIGGSGVYSLGLPLKKKLIKTPYDKKAVAVYAGDYKGIKIAFLNRHGKGHSIPPHLINYRSNIFALKKIGINKILAINAVGAISKSIKVGDFVIVDQFIDFTKSRQSTFFEGGKDGVVHTDMTNPFCEAARNNILKAAAELKIKCVNGGAVAVCEGPRYETAAEIKAYKILRADVVGMTTYPEAALARELNICYASICVVSNYAAGVSNNNLNHKDVLNAMAKAENKLGVLVKRWIEIDGARNNQ
ncbi:MAG: S-methyl-5'-thioinosine phosphorylase [Patescibacteria group bacterium]|nr:S-methyl-5'-thioinosine phosphorylase [Patescibacteria group bacterium]